MSQLNKTDRRALVMGDDIDGEQAHAKPTELTDSFNALKAQKAEQQRIVNDYPRLVEENARLHEIVESMKSEIQVVGTPANALVFSPDGMGEYKGFQLHHTYLSIPEDVPQDDWVEMGVILMNMKRSISWMLGDWLAYAMKDDYQLYEGWISAYQYVASQFGYEVETLYSYASVCRKIATLTRVKVLSFSHHRLVTKFDNDTQFHWLNRAVEGNWSERQMRTAIQESERKGRKPLVAQWAKPIAKLESTFSAPRWQKLNSETRKTITARLRVLLERLEEDIQ
jgi:hypothetical protein